MRLFNGHLDDAYTTWLASSVACCSSLKEELPQRGNDLFFS